MMTAATGILSAGFGGSIAGEASLESKPLVHPYENLTPRQVADIEALVTERLLKFHDAMVERGQIPPITVENLIAPQAMAAA